MGWVTLVETNGITSSSWACAVKSDSTKGAGGGGADNDVVATEREHVFRPLMFGGVGLTALERVKT